MRFGCASKTMQEICTRSLMQRVLKSIHKLPPRVACLGSLRDGLLGFTSLEEGDLTFTLSFLRTRRSQAENRLRAGLRDGSPYFAPPSDIIMRQWELPC